MMGGRNEEAGSYQLRPSLPVIVTTARCESAQNPASFEQRSAMRLGLQLSACCNTFIRS